MPAITFSDLVGYAGSATIVFLYFLNVHGRIRTRLASYRLIWVNANRGDCDHPFHAARTFGDLAAGFRTWPCAAPR